MNKAATYTRQSLDKTGDGLAVARQQSGCDHLCETRGWQIVARESDNDVSGYSGKPRPGYQRIVELIETRQVDVIVVWAVDRLTRRLADLVSLIDMCERTGVKIATVSGDLDLSTDQGRLIARILGSVAQGEVERKATRQKAAALQAAGSGKARTGCPRPFGWLDDRITRHPGEGPAVQDACRSLLAGGTISGIARDWTARGLLPHQPRRPRNAPFGPLPRPRWTRASVVTILRNPRNAGISIYRGEEVGRGEWDALIGEDTWRAVTRLLGDESRRRKSAGVRTLLGGLGYCQCGNYVSSSVNHLGTHVYRCNAQTRNGQPGPHVAVRASEVDRFVGERIVNWVIRWGTDLLEPERKADTSALYAEYQEIEAANETLESDYYGRRVRMTEARFAQLHEANDRRLDEIKAQLASIERVSAVAPLVRAKDVRAAYEALPDDRKRAVIAELMTVTLRPSGRGARTFDARRVMDISWLRDLAA